MDDSVRVRIDQLRPPPYIELPTPISGSPYTDTRTSRYHPSWPRKFTHDTLTTLDLDLDLEKATSSISPPDALFDGPSTYSRPKVPRIQSSYTTPYTDAHLPLTPLRSFAITLVFILLFLIAPIWTLNFIGPWRHQLLLISVLVLFFGGMLAVHTSRLAEVLGATAAYAAVLMFFVHLGNAGTGRELA